MKRKRKKDRARRSKRTKAPGKQRRSTGPSDVTRAQTNVPSAASLYRLAYLDPASNRLIASAASWLEPSIAQRDRDAVTRIRRANSAEELIELVPLATGLGEPAWQERVRQFGLEAVALISQRLAVLHQTREKELRHMMLEKLIGALRWQGDAGAKVLLERFDGLDDYGRCLACVVLGLLGERSAADKLWHFYQRVVHNRRESHFVGALWGLIDLADERAAAALADLLDQGRDFYELYGSLSLVGDARVIVPVLSQVAQEPEENEQAAMALVSIAHRIGRDAFMAELGKVVTSEEPVQEREAFVERFLSVPESEARAYFGWLYGGRTS